MSLCEFCGLSAPPGGHRSIEECDIAINECALLAREGADEQWIDALRKADQEKVRAEINRYREIENIKRTTIMEMETARERRSKKE